MGTANHLNLDSLKLLHTALNLLSVQGFEFIDLPWAVHRVYSDATRPEGHKDFATPIGSLVASGEQSFLQMWGRGELPFLKGTPGYVGWTPCFRDEPILDEFHQSCFLKVEWFVPNPQDPTHLLSALLDMQQATFCALAQGLGVPYQTTRSRMQVAQTASDTYDINVCGIEVGSYGLRTFRNDPYLYGTGLALPRFTTALAPLVGK